MANVAYLVGVSARVVFDINKRDREAFGGKKEPFLLLKLLANNNPENTYFLFDFVNISTLKKYKESQFEKDFKYKNVRFIVNELYEESFWKKVKPNEARGITPEITDSQIANFGNHKKIKFAEEELIQKFKENIDYGICFSFPPNLLPAGSIRNGKKIKVPIASNVQQYTLQAIQHLNFSWVVYSVDMRYIGTKLKVANLPKAIFCFETKEWPINNQKIPMEYGGSDLLLVSSNEGLVSRESIKVEEKIKRINSYTNFTKGFDRFSHVKEFVLDQFEGSVNYGNLEEENEQLQPMLIRSEMSKNMALDRYNYITPSSDFTLTSAKPWECLYHKVIPFMHQSFGSSEWRKFHNWPEFLFVSTPEELKHKVEILNSSEEKYLRLLRFTQNILKDSYLNGELISDNLEILFSKYCK